MPDPAAVRTNSWHAWLDAEPPGGGQLHVRGVCTTPNEGWAAALRTRHPQGPDPPRLLLDLILTEPTGIVAQVETDLEVHYHQAATAGQYTGVSIFGPQLVELPIELVS